MPSPKGLTSKAGSAKVLYIVATAEEPMTVSEIAALLEANHDNVYNAMLNLYRAGFLVRRNTYRTGGEHEYALAPPDEFN